MLHVSSLHHRLPLFLLFFFKKLTRLIMVFFKLDNEESSGPEPTLDPNEVQTAVPWCGGKRHADPMIV
jgi:hypothetical protein